MGYVEKWTSTRLMFYRDRIEPLDSLDRFRIETPDGAFEMTKSDFYRVFDNVVQSRSWRGLYRYTKIPQKARPFQLPEAKQPMQRHVEKWTSTRLMFYRDRIEPLDSLDRFRIETPDGTFEMTKSDFCRVFPGVVQSQSYRVSGYYHYPSIPGQARPFLVEG